MAKKDKPSVDKIVRKVNKEFEKTSSQIENLINDALKQFDSLQNQIQEPVRKLVSELDGLREREMKRFNEELERRRADFHELQETVLERLGLATREARKDSEEITPEPARTTTKAKTPGRAPSGKTAKAAAKPASAEKSAAKTRPASKKTAGTRRATADKPASKADLTRVKGVGPATAKKMKEMGITSIDQIANPTPEEQEKLKTFAKMKGFNDWSGEAKKLL